MQEIQLFLNGERVDLSDDSPIALNFQINNLADVQNQQGNTSNQFKLPLTQRNRRILGFPDDIRITTNTPYTQLDAILIQNGIEVIPAGIGEISGADDNYCDITILSGNVDFFDTISPQIYDMGDKTTDTGKAQVFKPYNHLWSLQNVVNARNKTDGYVWPVIDYGRLSVGEPLTVDVRQLRPGFYIKTAIELIVDNAGYKATGSLLNDPLYPLLVAQFSNGDFEHGTDYQNQPDNLGVSAVQTQQIQYSRPFNTPVGANLTFNQINSDPANQFTNGASFTAAVFNDCIITVKIPHLYFKGYVTPAENTSQFNVAIKYHQNGHPGTDDVSLAEFNFGFQGYGEKKPGQPGSDSNGWTRLNGSSGSNLYAEIDILNTVLSIEAQVEQHDSIYIEYTFTGRSNAYAVIFSGSTIDIVSQKQNVNYGQEIQCERIFPDISQKDLLKDTLQRFGIICQTDNTTKTINFISLKEIIDNIPVAKDWTKKCINVGKNNSFKLGDYAQVNNLTYKTDDAITLGYADDVININDKTLDTTAKTIIESQFAASLQSNYIAGSSTAQILTIDTTNESNDFTIGVSPRILVMEQLNLLTLNGGTSIKFTDGTDNINVNDVITTGYFYKVGGKYNLCWKDQPGQPGLRSKYYAELEKVLKQTKVVSRYFLLTPRDIAELDLTIPVYLEQDNAYFYINKINTWQKGVACKVDFVKLGEI